MERKHNEFLFDKFEEEKEEKTVFFAHLRKLPTSQLYGNCSVKMRIKDNQLKKKRKTNQNTRIRYNLLFI